MAYICVALARSGCPLAEVLRGCPGSRDAMQAPAGGPSPASAMPHQRLRSACPSGPRWHSSKGQSRRRWMMVHPHGTALDIRSRPHALAATMARGTGVDENIVKFERSYVTPPKITLYSAAAAEATCARTSSSPSSFNESSNGLI